MAKARAPEIFANGSALISICAAKTVVSEAVADPRNSAKDAAQVSQKREQVHNIGAIENWIFWLRYHHI
jgi:hypothetical protein